MKKIICVLIAMFLLLGQITIAIGASDIMPRWDNTYMVSCEVTFSGTNGTVYSRIRGVADATKIRGTLVLYENNDDIITWNIDVDGSFWSVLETFEGVSGKTYKLELEAEVYKDGVWEDIEKSHSSTCP